MRRFLILLLALGLGALSIRFWYGFGDEGYTIWAALPPALPLLVGLCVANSKSGRHKYVRWLCVVPLLLETLLMSLSSEWFKLLALLPLLGVLLLLWPEIKSSGYRRVLQITALPMASLVGLFCWQWFHFPLPSDAEMIKHFNAHRTEFEQLVQGYRNFRRYLPSEDERRQEKQINEQENKLRQRKKLTPDARLAIAEDRTQLIKKFGPEYRMLPEVKALMEKSGVYNINAGGTNDRWFPDHYSAKTIQAIKLYEKGSSTADRIDILRREMPNLFEGTPPVRDLTDLGSLIEPVKVEMGTLKQPARVRSWRYNINLLKFYYHFPQPTRVENGHLLIHDFKTPTSIGFGSRVLDSLDDYPPDWQPGECVLKRIDEHWFIALCRIT